MPRVLILSTHFYPSPAVGAKRVSELACRLRDEGWQVTVISAPGKHVPELAERIHDLEHITIAPPPKIYPLLAYWPKRLLRRSRGTQGVKEAPVNGSIDPHSNVREETGARRESPLPWLKRHYHALELTLDDSKLWSLRVLLRAMRLGARFDWVISSGPPHSVHVAARLLAGLRRARWVMDLRDPIVCTHSWPEQEMSASALRRGIELLVERRLAQRADRVTAASPGTANALVSRVPIVDDKMEVILNGYDGRAATNARPSGRLRLLYAGSLYLNRNPFPLLEALRELVSRPDVDRSRVQFRLVGQCERWNGRGLEPWISATGMHDVVEVLPAVSPTQVTAMMQESEVLVNFAQGQPQQIPAKLYDYIASGREMLLIAEDDSDAARVTRESGTGRIVAPDDRRGLQSVLHALYGFYVERGLAYVPDRTAIERFSREQQNRRFIDLLDTSAARGTRLGPIGYRYRQRDSKP